MEYFSVVEELSDNLHYIIGLPSFGSYGQSAVDILLATEKTVSQLNTAIELVGVGESELLLPLVGYESQDGNKSVQLSYPIEFYKMKDSSVVFLLIRSICREMDEQCFAKQLAEFLKNKNYRSAILLTSACSDDWDLPVMHRKTPFFSFVRDSGNTELNQFPEYTSNLLDKTWKMQISATFGKQDHPNWEINQSNQLFPFGMEIAAKLFENLENHVIVIGKFAIDSSIQNEVESLQLPALLINELKLFQKIPAFSASKSKIQLKLPASWQNALNKAQEREDNFNVW